MPKTQPRRPRPPAKCLRALGPGAWPALKTSRPPSCRMTGTAWRKVRGGLGHCSQEDQEAVGLGGGDSTTLQSWKAGAAFTPPLSPESPRGPSDSHEESSAELEDQALSGPQAAQCPAQVLAGGRCTRGPTAHPRCSDPPFRRPWPAAARRPRPKPSRAAVRRRPGRCVGPCSLGEGPGWPSTPPTHG